MKNTKRFLALLLAVVMVIGMVPSAAAMETTTESAPTESTPTESTPTESTPTESTPTESTPTESTPTESTPTESTPTESTPTESTPTESTPTESTPTESTPTESTPTESTPTESTPTESTPTESTPAESTPTESTPVEEETKSAYLIKGAKLYKDYTDAEEEPKVIDKWNTEIKIGEPITAEDGTTWYKFSYSNVLAELFNGYNYVKTADVTIDKCTCETEETEHEAGCALYTHVPTSEVTVGDGNTVSVAGAPEDAALQIADPDEDALDTVLGIVGAQYGGATTFAWGRSVPTPQRRTTKIAGELFAYDISILNPDGTEWQPGDEPVTITLNIPGLDIGEYQNVCVAHMHGDEVKMINAEVDEAAETITFTTDGFSVFYGFIVDFEFDGEMYSLSGTGEVKLSELMTALKIGYSISDVDNVKFTNSSVLKISEEDGDWLLTSLKPFSTEEYLDLYFNNGEIISIIVTDPVLKYYLPGTDWDLGNGTKTVSIIPSGGSAVTLKANNANSLATADFYTAENGPGVKVTDVNNVPTATHMTIYLRAGEALEVTTGTYFPYGSWDYNKYNSGSYTAKDDAGNALWTWIYGTVNGTATNYIVTENVNEPKTCTIQFRNSASVALNGWICNVQLVIVPENTSPTLVEDTLGTNSQYEIRELDTTLYNYNGKAFNEYYQGKQDWLIFYNISEGVSASANIKYPWSGASLPNSGNVSTGIMKKTLGDNGLPEMKSTAQTDLFSTNTLGGVKEVFTDVGFQFIYNKNDGYYTYSSNLNHAQFDVGEKKIKLYNETLAPYYSDGGQNSKAGFYPFADINKAFLNQDASEHVAWNVDGNLSGEFFQQDAIFAKDIVTTTTASPASTVDMHFGLQLDVDFYMPAGSQVDVDKDGTKEDLVYKFTGDDDLWVYIDDQLVLDIGGAHTAVNGTINFTQKTVTVSNSAEVDWNGSTYVLTDNGFSGAQTWTFDQLGISDITEDQMHTMRIFYLERWSGESNCRMHFNLPVIPKNSVLVSKNVSNQNGDELSVNPDVSYTFQIVTKYDDGTDSTATNQHVPLANYGYTVDSTSGTTNANGEFTLKAGETAVFPNISRFTNVYIVEKDPNNGYIYPRHTVSVNGGTATNYAYGSNSPAAVMGDEGNITFTFHNYMETQPLKIQKNVIGGADALNDPNQAFTFTLDFTKTIKETATGAIKATKTAEDDTSLTDGGTFTLKHGESITIPRVPVNMTYDLKEAEPADTFDNPVLHVKIGNADETVSEWEFDTVYSGTIGEQTSGVEAINLITVDNQQRFNLTITKKIVKADGTTVDTDAKPDQSFKFEITGVTDPSFKTAVLISAKDFANGQASVTVNGLRAGEYKVKEITAWSSRYTLKTDNNVTVSGNTPAASFSNYRSENKWLDFEDLVENVFNAKTATE